MAARIVLHLCKTWGGATGQPGQGMCTAQHMSRLGAHVCSAGYARGHCTKRVRGLGLCGSRTSQEKCVCLRVSNANAVVLLKSMERCQEKCALHS